MVISGVIKGYKEIPYSFNDARNVKREGTTRYVFIEDEDEKTQVENRLVKIKIPKDLVINAEVGSSVDMSVFYDNEKGTLIANGE